MNPSLFEPRLNAAFCIDRRICCPTVTRGRTSDLDSIGIKRRAFQESAFRSPVGFHIFRAVRLRVVVR